jgi:hypothetical protein
MRLPTIPICATLALCAVLAASAAAAADALPAPVNVAQLGRWLHGEPPPHSKAAPPKQLAVVSTAPGVAVDAAVESFLREFAAALKAREGQPLLARLAPQYSIDGLPSGSKPAEVFLQAVDRLPGPERMTVQSVTVDAGQRVAKVEFRFSNERVDVKTLRLDASGRLLHSDLFRVQRAGHGA